MIAPLTDLSRRDTTAVKTAYLGQLALGAEVGTRRWVRHALRLRVAESRADCHLAADVVRHRHVLQAWPVPPRTKFLTYLSSLDGGDAGPAGAAGLVMVALLPNQYHARIALGLGQLEVLTLVRMWRADDLVPAVAPDLTPETLRRVVRGERGRGPLLDLRSEWCARKLDERLRAAPRLLATYADPAYGHDGATYLAAGAVDCGAAKCGKRLFAWALDDETRAQLRAYADAVAERCARDLEAA